MANDTGGYASHRLNALAMRMSAEQTTNISTGDHIKFDVIDFYASDGAITPDIKSAYTNGAGMSLGRIRLAPGYVYDMECYDPVDIFSASSGQLNLAFYDVVSGTELGTRSYAVPVTDATNAAHIDGYLRTIYAPLNTAIVEVRLVNSTSLTRIGATGLYSPTIIVRTL